MHMLSPQVQLSVWGTNYHKFSTGLTFSASDKLYQQVRFKLYKRVLLKQSLYTEQKHENPIHK